MENIMAETNAIPGWCIKETSNSVSSFNWVLSSSDTVITIDCRDATVFATIETDDGIKSDQFHVDALPSYLFGFDERLIYKDIIWCLDDDE